MPPWIRDRLGAEDHADPGRLSHLPLTWPYPMPKKKGRDLHKVHHERELRLLELVYVIALCVAALPVHRRALALLSERWWRAQPAM